MRIGLDIDGVIYQWDKTARYMLREVLPNSPYNEPDEFFQDGLFRGMRMKSPLRQESQSWDYIQKHVAPEHWEWLWTEGVRLGLFRYGHLFPGAVQAVRKMAEKNDVILVTHRPKAAVKDTLAWLALQDLPIVGLHLLTEGEPKSTVRPSFDAFIDDKPENVEDVSENSDCMNVILMRRPWNRHFKWSYGMTFDTLEEVANELA